MTILFSYTFKYPPPPPNTTGTIVPVCSCWDKLTMDFICKYIYSISCSSAIFIKYDPYFIHMKYMIFFKSGFYTAANLSSWLIWRGIFRRRLCHVQCSSESTKHSHQMTHLDEAKIFHPFECKPASSRYAKECDAWPASEYFFFLQNSQIILPGTCIIVWYCDNNKN